MWLYVREALGWILLLIGLYLIYVLVRLVNDRAIIEAFAISFPATIVFRAGIGMIRLATAGRIAKSIRQQSTEELDPSRRLTRAER